ncbi:nuclear transport factor 2 family protein [Chitinophaga sp. 30R24]|uniref:nuclear transport factor 2 family protein n=1 Tax=Chitinophaga sp. 30R24 TaxID=3248838 RepID=UPI003B90FE39
MSKFAPIIAGSLLGLFACHTTPKEDTAQAGRDTSQTVANTDFTFNDRQQIEGVVLNFCDHFDNGQLDKCMEYMDDSIRGEIDGIKLKGKQNWSVKIDELLKSTKNSHFQPRHILTNLRFFPAPHDTVKVSMYASCFWTDLTTGQIQLMSIGYYKGKVVKKDGKWLIAVFNSLPDSRLVKQYYQDIQDSIILK